MIIKGFRFGMLLQFAIGPVCIYIFMTATNLGIFVAEAAVLGVFIMDAVFVALAIVGVGSLLNKDGVKMGLKYFGAIVLVYFGLGIILGSFGINIIPKLMDASINGATTNAFVSSLILTASSPLTILFWTGVFASKLSCEEYKKKEMILFGIGAVLATLVFLSGIAIIAALIHPLINKVVMDVLNVVVGVVIIGFGVKVGVKKQSTLTPDPSPELGRGEKRRTK